MSNSKLNTLVGLALISMMCWALFDFGSHPFAVEKYIVREGCALLSLDVFK